MVYVSIIIEVSQEANWNGQTGRQADGKDHILSQDDTLTKKSFLITKMSAIWLNVNTFLKRQG